MDNKTSEELTQFLLEENKKLKISGCNMASAALHVVSEYDGLHRLMLAVSDWAETIANESGRDKKFKQ